MTQVELTLNGRAFGGEVEPRTHLADFLRDCGRLTATHLRCEQGVCGACTILIDGVPARSCITYAVQCQGAEVTTLEGLLEDPVMQSLQKAFSAEHGLQCGFCTPGMLVTARDIVSRLPDADDRTVRQELSGNLCRCTGYAGIVRAIRRVLEERKSVRQESPPELPQSLGPAGARHRAGPTTEVDAGRPSPPAASTAAEAAPVAEAGLGLGTRKPNLSTSLSFPIRRPADEVWDVLEDVERVARCMPGAKLDGPPAGNEVKGSISVRMGPIATNFHGAGIIERDEERREGVMRGSARDRLSGSSARAEVVYAVRPDGSDSTIVDLTLHALLAGPLAQFGRSGIVQDLVARLAADFAERLEHSIANGEEAPDSGTSLNPMKLLLAVAKARARLLVARFFGARK